MRVIKWKICIKFGCWISLRNTWLGYLHYMQSEIHIINFVCFNCNNSKKWSWELHWWRMRSNHRKASLRRVRVELCLHKKTIVVRHNCSDYCETFDTYSGLYGRTGRRNTNHHQYFGCLQPWCQSARWNRRKKAKPKRPPIHC